MTRVSLAVLLLLTCAPVLLLAQAKAVAKNLEVVPRPNCETEKLFLQYFRSELEKDPNANGIVVIKGAASELRGNFIFESSVRNFLQMIGADPTRYEVVQSGSSLDTSWEMWIVPAGADPPPIESLDWSYKIDKNAKPFRFTWENGFADDICPPVDDIAIFAKVLRANPQARANLVIRGTKASAIEKIKRRVLTNLIRNHGVRKSRIRVFVAREIVTGMKPLVEYWFVP